MREEKRRVFGDRRIQRGRLLEIGNQFAQRLRIHDRAGKLVRADFAAFFQDVDILGGKLGLCAGFVVLLNEIREVQRAGKPGGSGADDQDIGFELFALRDHRYAPILAKER